MAASGREPGPAGERRSAVRFPYSDTKPRGGLCLLPGGAPFWVESQGRSA